MNAFALLRRPFRRALRFDLRSYQSFRQYSTSNGDHPESLPSFTPPLSLSAKLEQDPTLFRPNDFILLRDAQKGNRSLIGPLTPGKKHETMHGSVLHDDIIGRVPRSRIATQRGGFLEINVNDAVAVCTLFRYVLHASRVCNPIYPKDAAMIVSFLDLHPASQVLEAGTGNGALTLYLARAIAGHGPTSGNPIGQIHTIDLHPKRTATANHYLSHFGRGMYAPYVRFHIGSCNEVLKEHHPTRTPFFDAAVLDMPEPWDSLEAVIPRLRNDRFLVCYLPNMTQVLELVKHIGLKRYPVAMEGCVEVDVREWEVRATVVRSRVKAGQQSSDASQVENCQEATVGLASETVKTSTSDPKEEPELAWVCRPKNYDVRGHTAFLTRFRKREMVVEEKNGPVMPVE
ncbi:S-adenosyl-L-methionine-dependent methyltransferase [Jimgerdemannia flammicorona]|uniref:tRNA (adenine(58)-N(1))-methyltransferase catalytic subunit TRM61 n=1 Tax=Jimgerdemannia flammicorona TaxID=994334 RepID=A0A433BTK2_9FUNG|nr:S-adenosyl-L-methionine-dependent methyltransferase [Jimgerdemannia flammicorona]